MIIDGVKITAYGFKPSREELKGYVRYVKEREKGNIKAIDVQITKEGGEDYVDLHYTMHNFPFERIRRITGYLTGTLDTWNDAKLAEERDRVKHDI